MMFFQRQFSMSTLLCMVMLLMASTSTTEAFQLLTPNAITYVSASSTPQKNTLIKTSTALQVFNENFESSSPEADIPTPEQRANAAFWKKAKEVNTQFWDYTCNFFYVAMSCLILLNFSGYGYTITPEKGLNVMPINTYRHERQWKEEIQRQDMVDNYRESHMLQEKSLLDNLN